MLAVLMVIPTITSIGAAEETGSENVVEETITESEEDASNNVDEEDNSDVIDSSKTNDTESFFETDSTEEAVEDEKESVTDVSNETEESNGEVQSLDEAAVERVIALFEDLPSITELDVMTPEEINETVQKANEAISAFDALPEAECQHIISNYSELYNYVMNEFSGKLMSLTQAEIAPMSLLPLDEKYVYLTLNEKTEEELKQISVDEMINSFRDSNGNKIPVKGNPTTVWRNIKHETDGVDVYEEYALNEGATIDLSSEEAVTSYTMELIIGSGKQLDQNNVRYIVTVYITDEIREYIGIKLYTEDSNGNRKEVIPQSKQEAYNDEFSAFFESYGRNVEPMRVIAYTLSEYNDSTEYYLGITSEAAKHPDVTVDVYDFTGYLNYLMGNDVPITDTVLNQNMQNTGVGYKGKFGMPTSIYDYLTGETTAFAVVAKDSNGTEISTSFIQLVVSSENDFTYVDSNLFIKNGNDIENAVSMKADSINFDKIYVDLSSGKANGSGIHEHFFMLKEGIDSSDDIYCSFKAHGNIYGDEANQYVVKAVVGLFDSLEEAEGQEDIKAELFPVESSNQAGGYKANYDYLNGGIYFTAFFEDGSVWKFNVRAMNYDPKYDENYIQSFTEAPIIGQADPWFRITGVSDSNGDAYDTYVLENGKNVNIDTMYGYGYQTVFINQDVDSFIPTFWKADEEAISIENIYFNGSNFNEGDSITFPEGENELNATFSVIINDKNGEHTKNYNVTFVKKTSGPQLYVAGPLDPEVRSVFLDEYHENKHDIFIANVGDELLTDLWLDLDATNVRLDDYWTIGGEGNNVLAACPDNFSLELDSTTYGELSNVAKIRLVPPEEGKGGEITGTLKIYSGAEGDAANSKLLATINLSGLAQNPDIITNEFDEAVKYVPYSYLVTTDNMYDWVDTSFELTAGSLPDGVELIPETGEIYGVPTEIGEFTFTVTATFDSTSENYDFEPVSKEYTLVVNDNTDDNVFNATDDDTDDNYSILDAIGEDTAGDHHYVLNEYGDVVFRSEGEFGQFVDVWLNGEKLEPGVDYTAEEGSTRITIRRQTLEGNKTNKDGERNTIAAEFRTTNADSMNDQNNSNELKRTAQNFYIELNSPTDPTDPTVPTNPSVPGGSGNPSTPGYEGGSTGTGINTPGGSSSSGGQGGSQGSVSNEVNIVAHIVYANNAPMVGYQVELHSDVKEASTDSEGNVTFNGVEIGNHSIYVKDSNGAIVATKNFVIQAGNALSINGNTITAVPGQTFSMTIQVNGTQMVFDDLQVISTPETGDLTSLYIWLFLAVSAGLIALECGLISVKKKRVRRS